MIDLIKSYNPPIGINELIKNPKLTFPLNVNEGGEINDRNQTCNYKNIRITINKKSNVRKLKGSIHVYWNNGQHNHNDFAYPDIVQTILDLTKTINVEPKKFVINHLEFGVNLLTDFNPDEVIKDLISHDGKYFHPMQEGKGKSCKHSQYRIKIYNKGFQYKLTYHVLRIEIKVNTMDYLHSKGILVRTLADLMDLNKLQQLAENLEARFNEILFFDSTIDITILSQKDQLVLSQAQIPGYREGLPNKSQRDMFRKKYVALFKTHAKRDWKKIIGPLIKAKVLDLLDTGINRKESLLHGVKDLGCYSTNLNETLGEDIHKVSEGDYCRYSVSL